MQEFTKYFNSFYGVGGLYPCRDVTDAELAPAIAQIEDFCGDSFDREKVRDLVFTPAELETMYGKV